jgi:excisionase family DNA binding protein
MLGTGEVEFLIIRRKPSMSDKEVSRRAAQRRMTLTVNETAKRLGIGRNQAYEAIKRGEIPVIRIGRRLLVPEATLDRMLNAEAA